MEGGRRPNDGPPQEKKCIIRIFVILFIVLVVWLIALIAAYLIYGFTIALLWYLWVYAVGFYIAFVSFYSYVNFCHAEVVRRCRRREAKIMPRGRRAAQGGQPVRVQRMPETAQGRNVNAAASSRTYLLDAASGPSDLQNPVVLFRSGESCSILQLGQQRTQAESTLSQEGSSRLSPDSGESSAGSRMTGVAAVLSGISSKRITGRDRIRTRSMAKRLGEASKQPAGEEIDPVPGPSHLHSPQRPLRNTKSSKYKTESESQRSERQRDLKSSIPGRSAVASGGVRKREKTATRKGSFETKLDSDDSEFSGSERD